jgi:hypothetical protein
MFSRPLLSGKGLAEKRKGVLPFLVAHATLTPVVTPGTARRVVDEVVTIITPPASTVGVDGTPSTPHANASVFFGVKYRVTLCAIACHVST